MKIIKEISENEMIATFLKAEIDSKRFGGFVESELSSARKSRSIIDNPDLSDSQDNSTRRNILSNYRGYGTNELLFKGFPSDIKWFRAKLSKEELTKVKYINYSYWNEISNGTRLATEAVKNIRADKKIFNESNDNFLEIADSIKNEGQHAELILVGLNEGSDLVVIEGHARLTGYMLALENMPDQTEVIVGFSEFLKDWGNY